MRFKFQFRADLREFHVGAALVQPQPAAFDRHVETGLVLGRAASMLLQELPVDQLDIDSAALRPARRSWRC